VFSWVLGWSLYWIGSKRKSIVSRKRNSSEELAFTVLMPEQKYVS
jgi:hypothetical protein